MIFHTLKEYVDLLKSEELIISVNLSDSVEKTVEYVSYNSKEVIADTLFICKGAAFRESYLKDAVKRGAIAYIAEKEYSKEVPSIIVKDVRKAMALAGCFYYNNPSEKLNLIGITGTKGKSTCAYYVKYILDEHSKNTSEKETAIISSIDTFDGKTKAESLLTTPESLDLSRHFNNAVESGLNNLVMEASSQALKYNRIYGFRFNYSVFLNISEDHISDKEHRDFDDYYNAKKKIFPISDVAFVNLDADEAEITLQAAKSAKKVYTFGKSEKADIVLLDYEKNGGEIEFSVSVFGTAEDYVLTMPGLFNIENALAAIGVTRHMGVPYETVYQGLKKARSSGRMELHTSRDGSLSVLVDYAHNKLSFEKLYESVKEEFPGKHIITVFGCPGLKAQNRREHLGRLAGRNSDYTILTEEDSGKEPTLKILEEIAEFVKLEGGRYEIIEDRESAIKHAVSTAPVNSVILLTGKGNETRLKRENGYEPYISDTSVVMNALEEYNKAKR